MKKSIILFLSLSVCILIFSNFSDNRSSYIFTTINNAPDLPENPYKYSDVVIPDHLFKSPETDTIFSGYESAGVDSSSFDFIEDDIATLGRVLFYDEKLSALENISCGSCHKQELSFAENKQFSEGISAPTRRNSMHLNDLAWTNKEGFFWDLSESDLKEMIRLPLTDDNEIGANMNDIAIKLGDTEYYPSLFQNAYGSSKINEDRITEALTHFISSFNSFNSKFDQAAAEGFSSFTESERRGLDIFGKSCGTCHTQGGSPLESFLGQIEFADPEDMFLLSSSFFNNGLPADDNDLGVGEWLPGMDHLFKPPSLRNIELTAPYMHDGRFNNIDEVIQHYSEDAIENQWSAGFIPPGGFQFSNEEKQDLKAFMITLTDNTFAKEEKWSDPFATLSNTVEIEITDVVVRPNPMSDISVIEFSNLNNLLASMNIYNASGQLMTYKNTTGSSFLIEKNEFPQGMYVIHIIMGDKRATRKLIVN